MSNPFGQVGAPKSRKTLAKYSASRSGLNRGPGSLAKPVKSCSPNVSSENRTRSLWAPKCLTSITFIIVQARDALQGLASTSSVPVVEQLRPVQRRPFPHQPCRGGWKASFYHFARIDGNVGLIRLVDSVKMRRRMIAHVHPHEYSVEEGDGRHAGHSSFEEEEVQGSRRHDAKRQRS